VLFNHSLDGIGKSDSVGKLKHKGVCLDVATGDRGGKWESIEYLKFREYPG
jgi:hypothetical protein